MFLDYHLRIVNSEIVLEIIDENFNKQFAYPENTIITPDYIYNSIIKSYSKLDISRNLFLCLLKLEEKQNWSINNQVNFLKSQKELSVYVSEIEKLLPFI